ncbi:helix-turn-helix transcriptional regulator [Streptomyces scabiei]|uniref:helix-turn-helix transcriptional regulator n=1 Tax=Streptomyces scabiei TaxID=1930 RepID=UPI002FF199BA
MPDHVWFDPDVRIALAAWDFGQASRLIRLRGSLRQGDMAQLTGLSQAFLSMLEAGTRQGPGVCPDRPGLGRLIMLAGLGSR